MASSPYIHTSEVNLPEPHAQLDKAVHTVDPTRDDARLSKAYLGDILHDAINTISKQMTII
jgi:cytochrome oxidase Cu insertion factor (SCO1/SenC/PrrC family)